MTIEWVQADGRRLVVGQKARNHVMTDAKKT